ncbi:hypothetical protein AKJ16_DCAP10905, partial [Drosera capensis]
SCLPVADTIEVQVIPARSCVEIFITDIQIKFSCKAGDLVVLLVRMSIKHLLFSVFSGSNSDGQDAQLRSSSCRWSNPLLVGAAEAFGVEVNSSGHRALVM